MVEVTTRSSGIGRAIEGVGGRTRTRRKYASEFSLGERDEGVNGV